MSSTPSARSEPAPPAGRTLPDWFWSSLGVEGPWQGTRAIGGRAFEMRGGIPRSPVLLWEAQAQTGETFGFRSPADVVPQTPAEVRAWCAEPGLWIEHEIVEEAGIAVSACKGDG